MHFFFSFFKSLKYSAFVSSNQRSLIILSRTIDLRMHSGWYDLPFKNNLLAAVYLAKLTVKIAFVRFVNHVKHIQKLQAFSCFYRCHYVYQQQKDILLND